MNRNLVILLIGIFVLSAFRTFRKISEVAKDIYSVKEGLKVSVREFGKPFTRKIEQAARFETAHFTSKQFLYCNSAGMEAFSSTFPYGWTSLSEFCENFNILPSEFFLVQLQDNKTGATTNYIKFPTAGMFIFFFAWFIKNKREGNVGKWNSLNEQQAANYNKAISQVTPVYTNEL